MLDELLHLLRGGGTHRVGDLARKLDTTPEMVEFVLEDLERMGYLRRVGGACEGRCSTCPMAGLCAAGSGGQIWTLTGKGQGEAT